MRIELYSKRRCPLCEDARRALERLRQEFGFELREIFIEDGPDTWERFRYDVPVGFVDGDRVFTHRVDEAALARRLGREAGTPVAHKPPSDA